MASENEAGSERICSAARAGLRSQDNPWLSHAKSGPSLEERFCWGGMRALCPKDLRAVARKTFIPTTVTES